MKVTNNTSFTLIAFGWFQSKGYGDDVSISPGQTADVNGPYLGEMGSGHCYIALPGELPVTKAPTAKTDFTSHKENRSTSLMETGALPSGTRRTNRILMSPNGGANARTKKWQKLSASLSRDIPIGSGLSQHQKSNPIASVRSKSRQLARQKLPDSVGRFLLCTRSQHPMFVKSNDR